MSIPTRKIGTAEVTAIGFGAMNLSAFYGGIPADEERYTVLNGIYQSGCRNIDTAHMYGDSEELLGKWFARTGKRSDVFVATKFGVKADMTIDGSPEYVRESLELSLKRLQTDYVDLYYQHRPDPKTPIEITVRAMAELVKEGKVRQIGLSEVSASTLRRAHAVHPIAAIQVEYSPFNLDIEDPKIALLATAKELGVAVVAYSPLGRGVLTGRFKGPEDFEEGDFRRMIPRYSKENFPNILKLSTALADIGKAHGASAGQIALAWIVAQGAIPIPGTTKIANWEDNMGALNIKLTEADMKKVREAAEHADKGHQGERYPAGMMQTVYAETPELKE